MPADDAGFPNWLQAVAVRVDELVGDAPTMNRFRRMLRDWKAEHEARGPKSSKDKRGNVQYNPVELLPVRGMTLPEKYAVLAAIHDAICEQTKRIDPWTTHKPIPHWKSPKTTVVFAYTVLRSYVAEWGDTVTGQVKTSQDGAGQNQPLAERAAQ